MAMKNHCESFGPDRAQLHYRKKRQTEWHIVWIELRLCQTIWESQTKGHTVQLYVKQNNHLSNRRSLCLTNELFAKYNAYILIVCQTKKYLTNRLSLCQTEYLFGKGVSLCQTKYLFVMVTFCKAKIIVIAIQRETSPYGTLNVWQTKHICLN